MSKRAYICGPTDDSKYDDTNSWAIVKPRKRRSRWSQHESDKTYVPGMPTQLPPNLSAQQEKMYILQLQVEDLTRRLKTGDLGIPANPDDRSPSPEPVYGNDGKRLNTRDYRTRKTMEDDRHNFIQMLVEMNPDYKPPGDYKPPQNKITDKIFIPQDHNPQINFVGLLIGPRGNTLKALEKETGAKIIIRGKGSVKDGKLGRRDGLPMPGEDEPLHAFISASNVEACQLAVRKITEIIRQGIDIPECENDLRKSQLRELALLNGTLREHEGLARLRAINEAQCIATNKIQCSLCGGLGHLMSDCKLRDPSVTYEQLGINPLERAKMDSEYSALMSELGVGFGGCSIPSINTGAKIQLGPIGKALPAKQPPPPGVPPSEDDEEIKSTGITPITSKLPENSQLALPPPPPVAWPMSYMTQPSAYPPAVPPTWPPVANNSWYMPPAVQWPPAPPPIVGSTVPVPAYGTGSDYWSGAVQPTNYMAPPPPPPPPPGL